MSVEAPTLQQSNHHVADAATLSALLASPWAITDQGRQQVVALVTQALQGREALPLRSARTATIREGVAVIPISGPLFKSACWFGSDYETILRDLNAALDDKEVKAIVLDVDSPGGLTSGCQELADAVFSARGKKPIVAYVSGMCASAAYWIATAADRIVATPTALVGSIGCFATLIDNSALLDNIGIKVYDIANDQSPFKVPDPSKAADRDRIRARVTELAGVFIGAVAKHRGVSEDRVEAKFGRGDVLVAASALTVGMIDSLGDFESLVTGLASAPASSSGSPNARAPEKKSSTRSSTPRAERKENMAKPDIDALKEHAEALYDAAHDDKHDGDGEKAAKAMAPHMEALHKDMGEHSPFDDDDGDEDGDSAKALISQLGGAKAAAGAIAAFKRNESRMVELEKQVAQAKAEKLEAEVKALIDSAMLDGRLDGAADRAEAEKLYAEAGVKALGAFLSRLPKKPAQAREPSAATAPTPAQAAVRLSATELELAARRGIKPEDFAAFKSQYMSKLKGGVAAQDKE